MTEPFLGRGNAGGSSMIPLIRRSSQVDDFIHDNRANSYLEEEAAPEHSSLKLLAFVQVLMRQRLLFLSILAVCVVVGAASAYLTTPMYRATATLELNPAPQKVVKTADSQAPTIYDNDFLKLQVGLIKSRSVAQRVARALNLATNNKFLGLKTKQAADENMAIGRLMGGFSAEGTTSDRLLRINFEDADPQIAAQVVNGYANGFIAANIESQFDTTAFTRKYLEQKLAATRLKLEQSETDLMAYSRQANILNIVSNDAKGASSADAAGTSLLASNLMALNQQLGQAQNARIIAEQKYRQSSGAVSAARVSNPVVTALQQQRATLQSNYDKELSTMREGNPTMVALKSQIDALTRQMNEASSQATSSTVGSLRSDYLGATNAEHAIEAKIEQLKQGVMNIGDRSIKYNILQRDVDANRSLYNSLLQRLKEEDTSATKDSNVSIVDLAQIPGAPFKPNLSRSIILGVLAGLVLGSLAAIAAEYIEDTIKVPDDLPNRLGLPLIGVVPLVGKEQNVDDLLADPRSEISEAFYSVRTALQFSTERGLPKVLFVTSSRPGEGKTSTALALATNMAMTGLEILLLDADLRNPSLLTTTTDHIGLAGLLTGQGDVAAAILKTEFDHLFLLPAGRKPPNPANLLAGNGLSLLIASLSERFDVIIIDGPPVLGIADAPLISSVCDATILLVEAGKTRRTIAATAIARLRMAGANVMGGILNKFADDGFGYGYGYGYGRDESPPAGESLTKKNRLKLSRDLGHDEEPALADDGNPPFA